LIDRFKTHGAPYPLHVTAPPQPPYPEPWLSNSDPVYADQPDILTYNRFFQHTMKFLTDRNMLKDIVWTFGISSAMYVATNAYGLPQNSFLSSAAWQIIGYETGATTGAQLGSGKRAWAVAGDGGFMTICQSLSTLARNKLNAVVFVMSNAVYAIEQVYVDMDAFKPGPEYKFDTFDLLPQWDYLALAQAFGAAGFRVTTVKELEELLYVLAEIKDKPALVEVVIPQKDLPGQMRRLGNE
jgi:indolepyruvate decarboxylase